jgi:hypothetical protein
MDKQNSIKRPKAKVKEDKNILIVNNANNQKPNYKRDDKERTKDPNYKPKILIAEGEKRSQRLRFKGQNLAEIRKIAMKAVSYEITSNHNTTYDEYNDVIVDSLICNKNCHIVAKFKDYMIFDFIDEFLKRYSF